MEVPHKYVSCSGLLNLVRLQKQLIPRDFQRLACLRVSVCVCVEKSEACDLRLTVQPWPP